MKNVKFRRELHELFSSSELEFIMQEANWIGEEENKEVNGFFFSRDKGMVEVFLPPYEVDTKDIEIYFLTTTKRTKCTKKECMQFLYNSKEKKLALVSVN